MRPFIILLTVGFLFGACEEEITLTGEEQDYTLTSFRSADISGMATLTKLSDGGLNLKLSLENTDPDQIYIAHIHSGDTSDFGPITVYLGYIYGDDPQRTDRIYYLDNDTPMTYDDWMEYEGYIAIHLRNKAQRHPVLAVGNIGASAAKE